MPNGQEDSVGTVIFVEELQCNFTS